MTYGIWLKALLLWFVILVLAILNGTLRETVLLSTLGSFAGHAVSGCILAVCIFLVAWFAIPWWGEFAARRFWQIGTFWLLLTLVFEFSFGRWMQHKSWAQLLEAYTFAEGNIWPLVLVAVLISPWLAAKTRGVL